MSEKIRVVERFIGAVIKIGVNPADPPKCESCKVCVDLEIAVIEVEGDLSSIGYRAWCSDKCRNLSDVIDGEVILPKRMLNPAKADKAGNKHKFLSLWKKGE